MPIPRQHKGDSKMLHILPSSHGKRDARGCEYSNQGFCTPNGKWCCDCIDAECMKNGKIPIVNQTQVNLKMIIGYQKMLKLSNDDMSVWLGFRKPRISIWKSGKFSLCRESRVKIAERINLYNGVSNGAS